MIVGVIGVGRMGSRMARRLMLAGHEVVVFDRDKRAAEGVSGSRTLDSPASVAQEANVIVISLPGPADVEGVVQGQDGVLADARAGLLVIDTSTNDPARVRMLAARCLASGIAFVDAPVSGGVGGAESGQLTAMVGGSADAFEQARPILGCFAAQIHHLGPIGSGMMAKLLNQSIYLSYVAAFCEMLRLARAAELDLPVLLQVLRSSLAGRPLLTGWDRQVEMGDPTPHFPIHDALKDLDLVEGVARAQSAHAPIFEAAIETYRDAAAHGLANEDMTTLARAPRER